MAQKDSTPLQTIKEFYVSPKNYIINQYAVCILDDKIRINIFQHWTHVGNLDV